MTCKLCLAEPHRAGCPVEGNDLLARQLRYLPPDLIASNHQFPDLQELWLGGDHYKWRAMRTNGANERFCTGDATPREKFQAWAETVMDDLGIQARLEQELHGDMARYVRIDTGAWAQDAWMSGDIAIVHKPDGGVWIFQSR